MSRLCRLRTKTHGEDGQWAYEEIQQLRQRVAELEKERDGLISKNQNLFNALMESTKLSNDLSSKGYRLAFVLECILLATDSDMAAISKYWDEAHAALEEWRK